MMRWSVKSAAAGMVALGLSAACHAEEASQEAASPTAAVNHDFSVTMPEFLFFQVGSAGATIDHMNFATTAANTGDGTLIMGTGGNAEAGSAATAVLRSNAGQVTITETNNSGGSGLRNVKGDFISYALFLTGTSNSDLPMPPPSDDGGNAALATLSGAVTDHTADWGFSYFNNTVVEAGIYGTSARGGRVTFTATTP